VGTWGFPDGCNCRSVFRSTSYKDRYS